LSSIYKKMINNIIFFILISFFISNCTKRAYYTIDYNEYITKQNIDQKQKIINTKAMHKATMRPYIVFGKKYYPTISQIGDKTLGVASWYGSDFHNKKTSNGEIYNMYALTAAHKTLPMNTMVKVKNLENSKEVIVRINDRGPFVNKRVIDLSNQAAKKIDMIKKGTAKVRLTIIGFNGKIAKTKLEKRKKYTINEYFLQIGVFRIKKSAIRVKEKFNLILENEYKVSIKKSHIGKKPIYKVLISGFRSKNEIEDFQNSNELYEAIIIAN
jgi:rare lipoprotein A